MSLWDKKFKQLLASSKENTELKARVSSLEEELGKLRGVLGDVMKSYVNLARMTMDHRKGLEEVFAFLTAESLAEDDDSMLSEEPESTPEELVIRKRMMN